jgi:tetratricopeptide (TPR) repeat protein
MELSPGTLEAYEEYSNYLMSMGRIDEAVEIARVGSEFDPLSVLPVHQLGIAYMASGDYEAAAAQFRKAQELRPGWVWGHIKRGKALAHAGQCDEALQEVARAEELLAGTGIFSWSWIGFVYGICDEEPRARDAITYLEDLDAEHHIDASALAVPYASLGDEARVLEFLERAYEERSPSMVFVGLFPEFYSIPRLRENPRFQEILTRMNLDGG